MECPRVPRSELTAETFLRSYVLKSRPVIITGAMEGWPVRDWTPTALVERFGGEREVEVAPQQDNRADKWIESVDLWPRGREICVSSGDALPGVKRRDIVLAVAAARVRTSLGQFAERLGPGEVPSGACRFYADGAGNLEKSFAFLRDDVDAAAWPACGAMLHPKRRDLWIGHDSVSELHYDMGENLFAQCVGAKSFVLVPPHCSRAFVDGRLRKAYMRWTGGSGGGGGGGSGDVEELFVRDAEGISDEAVLNYAAFDILDPPSPRPRRLMAMLPTVTATVRAGELLYLPAMWWHRVTAIPDPTHGMCASISHVYTAFYTRASISRAKLGPMMTNPFYNALHAQLGLVDDPDEDDTSEASTKT